MKLLFRYLAPYKSVVFLALLLSVINNASIFLNPYILGNLLIDPYASKVQYFRENGLQEEFLRGITIGILLMVAASTVSWVAKGFQNYLLNVVIQKLGANLYVDVQRHTLRLPYQDFEDQRSGEILSILQRARVDCEKFITKFVTVFFSTIIGIVVVAVIAFQLSVWLPVIYIGGAVIMTLVTNAISRKVKYIQKGILDESTALAGSATESIRNIELIKGLGLIQQEVKRLGETTFKILKEEIRKLKSIRQIGFIYSIFIHSLHQGIMFCLLLFVFYDSLTVGQLLMMQLYFYFIFGALEQLGEVVVAYRETEASLNNLGILLSKPTEQQPAQPEKIESLVHLRLENVHFQHQSATHPALEEVSFEAGRGETIAIVGPSGSGKTTLVKLLVGLYTPTAGKIHYNDHSHEKIDLNDLRRQIGLVTQDTQLFSGTIKENLLFANSEASNEDILDVLRKAACQNLLARAEKGIDTVIGEGGLKISGGERQRLSIARSLLRESSLLIFDEATSSLDSLTEEGIAATIRQVTNQKKYITLIVAHRLSTIMFADRIYVLERGRVVETGNHYTLLEEKGLYYAMWRQQTGERRDTKPATNLNMQLKVESMQETLDSIR